MVFAETESFEMERVEELFQTELAKWKADDFKIKLLILGEAPLSHAKYFYGKNRGGWLSGIRAFLGVEQNLLLTSLRNKGILAIDLYKYPIETKRYDEDKANALFDKTYVSNRIAELESQGLLDESTKAVYRYKKLIHRELPIPMSLKRKLITDGDDKPISLFTQERPNQLLSADMEEIINRL